MTPGAFAAALLQPAGHPDRRSATEEIERQITRALWRAERRGRGLPFHVRQSFPWVNAQRKKIAHEVTKAVRSLGAGAELAVAIATQACERFPRDGVVIPVYDSRRPRDRGDAPRQVGKGKNPRALGTSPRQRGTSPRQKRAAADLTGVDVSLGHGHDQNAVATTGAKNPIEISSTVATGASDAVGRNTDQPVARTVDELAPEWTAVKDKMLQELEPHERIRAKRKAREDRERLQRSQNAHPSPPDTRS